MKKKKLKFNHKVFIKDMEKMFMSVMFILSFFGTLTGTGLFFIGFHNFDLGHNLNWVNCDANKNYVDFYDGENYYTAYKMISNGSTQMIIGFSLGMFSMFYFTILLCQMLIYTERGEKNV